jgi:hypothetical protein
MGDFDPTTNGFCESVAAENSVSIVRSWILNNRQELMKAMQMHQQKISRSRLLLIYGLWFVIYPSIQLVILSSTFFSNGLWFTWFNASGAACMTAADYLASPPSIRNLTK